MSEWSDTTLGAHLTRVKRKVKVKDGVEYRTVSVTRDGAGLGKKESFVGGVTNYASLFRVTKGDVVVRTITAFESPVAVAHEEHDGTHVSGVFLTYEVPDSALPAFFELLFQTPKFWNEMRNRATGTVQRRKTISDSAFRAIPVALPPVAEQRRIIDVMASIDAHAVAVQAELARRSDLRLRLLHESAGCDERVDAIADVSQGKSLPQAAQGQRTGDVSWFKIVDMTSPENEDGYTLANTRLTSEEVQSLRGVVVPAGAVTFPRVGAAVLTEKKRILDVSAALDENHLVLTPKPGVSSEYLLASLQATRLADHVQTGAVPSLNMTLVRAARIPWCSAQAELGATFGGLRGAVRAGRAELTRLRMVRAALLAALVNQDIRIPDSYDTVLEAAS